MSKRTIVIALGAIMALVVGWQVAAFAAHPENSLQGSNFEIDTNANLKQEDASPSVDWGPGAGGAGLAQPPEIRQTDKATGQQDDSYAGGTKANTECPDQTTGSIPNNKSDLLTFHAYTEPASSGNLGFLNLAWSRVSDPSGTTLMDFELNQSSTRCPLKPGQDPAKRSPNIVRTQGDILLEYAIDQGGSQANISARIWNATTKEWGNSIPLSGTSSQVCGGQPCAAGTINNTAALPAAESDGLGDKALRTFGEAQLDVRFLLANATGDGCVGFGSAQLKSRSSDQITPQLKDFIVPTSIDVNNCGALKIVKNSTKLEGGQPQLVSAAGTVFSYDKTPGVAPPAVNVTDDNTAAAPDEDATVGEVCVDGLAPGDYTITEVTPPPGYAAGPTPADVVATVVAGTDCNTGGGPDPAAAATVTFTDPPVADIQVNFRDGGSGETSLTGTGISCGGVTATPNAPIPTGWTASKTFEDIAVSPNPRTITCTIVIDP